MPDDPFDQALTADPATRHRDALDAALAADPATRRRDAFDEVLTADPATRHRSAQPATPQDAPVPSQAPPPTPPADGSAVASTSTRLVGNNSSSIAPFLRQTGQSLDPTRAPWCAAYVNGVLGANGIDGVQGPGKNIATSFLNWGAPVQGDPQPGDVLVQPRGNPAGSTGGHVGIAVGPVAEGSGGKFYLMQSGDYAGKVSYSWEPAQSLVVRRAQQPTQQATR